MRISTAVGMLEYSDDCAATPCSLKDLGPAYESGDTSSSGATDLRALTGKKTGRGAHGEKGAIMQRSEQGTKRGGAAPEVCPRSIKYHLHVGACTCTATTTFDYADKPASASRQHTKQGAEKGELQRTRYGRAHAPHTLIEGRGEMWRGERGEGSYIRGRRPGG